MFESSNGDFDIQKNHINGKGEFVITAGLSHNGIFGKTDVPAKIFNAKTITIDMFGNAFYRQFKYKIVTHARVFSLKPLFNLTDSQGLFFSITLHFLHFYFGYENMCSWEKIKDFDIQLPLTPTSEIDFDFMESFIREIEAERMRELNAYLQTTGLKDYELTTAEQQALNAFEHLEWGEYKIGDLFEKLNLSFNKSKFNKNTDISKSSNAEFSLPLVNAKDGNNGIMYYGRPEDFESAKMTIDIINDGAISAGNVYSQPQETGVLYNAYLIKPKFYISTNLLHFFTVAIRKSIKMKFSYELKATWERVKKETIYLPTNNSTPDYAAMETLISAVQKLVIKDVVQYTDKRIAATAQMVK